MSEMHRLTRQTRKSGGAACALLVLLSGAVGAQVQQSNAVQDGSGCALANGTMAGLTAGGQVVAGRNASGDGRFANYSGFLASVLLQPMLDTDGDGLCDEMDGDNDADGLPDGDELLADTNPNDFGSVLAFLSMTRQVGGGMQLAWQGGRQARQILMRRNSMTSGEWMAVTTNLPPTSGLVRFGDEAGTNPAAFYRIVVDRAQE